MKVYISHAWQDAALCSVLAKGLQGEGLQVWLPQYEIYPGDNWAEKVAQALNESAAMVLLLTPAALNSPNVQWELGFALGNIAYEHRVISVLVGSEEKVPLAGLPGVLRRLPFIRIAGAAEIEQAVQHICHSLAAAA
ncbi:MAG: toll/interleukin-1 receptor domain-containing protein [Verrucomicrobia bacterium]|nr:toll/interleukin-1 receptor domain-containing protein [Verrucomicrobiota bacterium]